MLQDFGVDTCFTNTILHWLQFFKEASLYGALAFEVDEQCALLGLFLTVLYYANEGFNDMLKRVEVVIEDNKIPDVDLLLQDFNSFLFTHNRFDNLSHPQTATISLKYWFQN